MSKPQALGKLIGLAIYISVGIYYLFVPAKRIEAMFLLGFLAAYCIFALWVTRE